MKPQSCQLLNADKNRFFSVCTASCSHGSARAVQPGNGAPVPRVDPEHEAVCGRTL